MAVVSTSHRRVTVRRWLTFVAFVAPALVLYTGLVGYPVVTALSWSFFSWDGLRQGPFVALENYAVLFTVYPYGTEIRGAVVHNVAFFLGTLLFAVAVGLVLALLLYRVTFAKRLFQVIYATPFLISPIVIGYLWSLLLSPAFGPASAGFAELGLDWLARPWLGDTTTALPVVILIGCWQFVGFPVLLFGAALAGVPTDCLDAAAVDGAGWFRTHWSVTMPLLTPALGIVGILIFINTFNVFDLVYAIGGSTGSPAGALDVLTLLFYRAAFGGAENSIGISSALSVMLFVFVFAFSFAANALLQRREASLT